MSCDCDAEFAEKNSNRAMACCVGPTHHGSALRILVYWRAMNAAEQQNDDRRITYFAALHTCAI